MPQVNKIKIRRGVVADLPAGGTETGELRYATDSKELFIDDGTNNVRIGVELSAAGVHWTTVPASASATGTAGQIAYDGGFLYVCSAANTWVRAALVTW